MESEIEQCIESETVQCFDDIQSGQYLEVKVVNIWKLKLVIFGSETCQYLEMKVDDICK